MCCVVLTILTSHTDVDNVIQAVDSAGLWELALLVMRGCDCGHSISKSYPITGLDRPLGLQEVEANSPSLVPGSKHGVPVGC